MLKKVLFLLFISFMILPPLSAFNIVNKGTSDYEIIVGKSALPITIRAAEDLQTYIEKSTGAKLPIIQADAVGTKPAIVVGDCPASQALGITLDGVAPEGFRIKTVGKNLVIAGRDTDGDSRALNTFLKTPQAGSWFGVCDLLEKRLGIRWFFPGKDGEYVPSKAVFSIDNIDFTDAPKMIFRMLTYAIGDDVFTWTRHNRGGLSIPWEAQHIWLYDFKAETYAKDHPDWFALVGSKRMSSAPLGVQMCTTNKGALDEFARVCIEKAKRNPGIMLSLEPNDGGGFCECENCRALDRQYYPDGTPILTDRIITYANEIANRVCKEIPDQKFGILAYSYYADPPTYAKVHPNIYIMDVVNCISALYLSEDFTAYHLKRLQAWKKQTDNVLFYSHPEGYGNMDLPIVNHAVLKKLYSNFKKAGIKGYSMNNVSSFAAYGLNNYLSLKMAWNPAVNIGVLMSDALPKCYGEKAAPLMKKYFDIIEQRTKKYVKDSIVSNGMDSGTVNIYPGIMVVYEGLYDETMPLITKALSLTTDKGQLTRIGLIRDILEYTKMTDDLCNYSKKIENGTADAALVTKACALASKWQQFIQANSGSNLISSKEYIDLAVNAWGVHVSTEYFDYALKLVSGGEAKVTITKASGSTPVIDGEFSDPIWANAPELSADLNKDSGTKTSVRTQAKVAYDKENLYISVICDEPLMDKIKDSIATPDGPVWNDNEIELFFDVNNDKASFKQLMVNTLGTISDFQFKDKTSSDWKSQAQVAVKKFSERWQMEIAIPFSSLSGETPLPGDIWGLNICRSRSVFYPAELTCWSPTFGGFLEPKRFGILLFE